MTPTPPSAELVEVRIVGLPLAVYRASAEHHDELRREFALVIAGETTGSASVPARLLTLIDALQRRFGSFGTQPTQELQAAMDRGDERIDLVYRVPPELKDAALQLDARLDEAEEFCRQGEHLLTLASPPKVLAFRRWFLAEFAVQVDGGQPTPWDDWVAATGSPS